MEMYVFFHKFTLQEIQDHWPSLLYNPEISTQASARMVEQHPGSMIKDEDATNNAPYVHSDVQIYDQHAYTQKIPELSEVNNVSLRGITDFQDSMQFQQLASSNQYGNEVAESKELLITAQVGDEHVHFPANNSGGAIWNGVGETDTLNLADDKTIKTANRDPLALQADGGICMPGLDRAAIPEDDYMDFPFFSNSDEFDLLNAEIFLNSSHEMNQEDLDDRYGGVAHSQESGIKQVCNFFHQMLVGRESHNMCQV
jgi:hypothetical protein